MLVHRNIVRALYITCIILNGISLILCLCALLYLIFAIFGLAGTPTEIAGSLGNRTVETWFDIKNRSSETWSNFSDRTENVWNNLQNRSQNSWDNIQNRTQNVWFGIRNDTNDAWRDVKNRTQNAWAGLQNRTQTGVNLLFNRTSNWLRNAAEPEFTISAKPPFETRFRRQAASTTKPEVEVEKKSLSSASAGVLLLDSLDSDLDTQFGLILYLMFYTAVAVLGLLGATMVYRKRKINFLIVHVVLLALIILYNFLAWFGFRHHSPLSQSHYEGGYLLLAALFDFLVLLVGVSLLASLIINRRHHTSVEKPRNSISPIMESGEG